MDNNQQPANRARTRAVRARMAATGESWTAAARHHDADLGAGLASTPVFNDTDVERWQQILADAGAAASASDPGTILLGDRPSRWYLVVPAEDADKPFARWLIAQDLMALTPEGPALQIDCTHRQASAAAMYLAGSFTTVAVQHSIRQAP